MQGQRCPPWPLLLAHLGCDAGQGCWRSCSDRAQPPKAGASSDFGEPCPWFCRPWGASLWCPRNVGCVQAACGVRPWGQLPPVPSCPALDFARGRVLRAPAGQGALCKAAFQSYQPILCPPMGQGLCGHSWKLVETLLCWDQDGIGPHCPGEALGQPHQPGFTLRARAAGLPAVPCALPRVRGGSGCESLGVAKRINTRPSCPINLSGAGGRLYPPALQFNGFRWQ